MTEDIRRGLMEGLRPVPSVGAVIAGQAARLPFFVVDSGGGEVEPVSACLRDLMLGDASPLTCRSYAFDLLRWHRLLWCLGTGWEKATEADVATLVGWLRTARNPQKGTQAAWFGSRRIGEPQDRQAVAANGIRAGDDQSRADCGARLPLLPRPFRRRPGDEPGAGVRPAQAGAGAPQPAGAGPVRGGARLRQKVPRQAPRAIPDALWDELFATGL